MVSSRTEAVTNPPVDVSDACDARPTSVVRAPGAHVAHETRVVLSLGATGAAAVFRYFPSLGVVTAEVRSPAGEEPGRGKEKEKEKGKKHWETLLVDLFPGDDGTRAPGVFVAGSNADANDDDDDENANDDAKRSEKILSNEWDVSGRRDRPFLWCQHLAGLDPTPLAPPLANSKPSLGLGAETNANANANASLHPDTTFSFENAAALERNVAAHAEQRRGATIVAALEARVKDVSSLERAIRFLAEAAEHRRGASHLVDDGTNRHATGAARAVLTSFRETFGDETDVVDESDGFAERVCLARRLAATGDGKSLAERGARRFALRVETTTSTNETRKGLSLRARATLEVTPSFPTRPASVALAVREPSVGDSSVAKDKDKDKDRPPFSPADADADGAFVSTSATAALGALGNDARLAEAEANLVDADEGRVLMQNQIDGAGAALVRRVARVLRAAETYFSGDDGNRRGRERRMAR